MDSYRNGLKRTTNPKIYFHQIADSNPRSFTTNLESISKYLLSKKLNVHLPHRLFPYCLSPHSCLPLFNSSSSVPAVIKLKLFHRRLSILCASIKVDYTKNCRADSSASFTANVCSHLTRDTSMDNRVRTFPIYKLSSNIQANRILSQVIRYFGWKYSV